MERREVWSAPALPRAKGAGSWHEVWRLSPKSWVNGPADGSEDLSVRTGSRMAGTQPASETATGKGIATGESVRAQLVAERRPYGLLRLRERFLAATGPTPGRPTEKQLLRTVDVGPERAVYQDPFYGVRALVDVATQALSPAVNAPTHSPTIRP